MRRFLWALAVWAVGAGLCAAPRPQRLVALLPSHTEIVQALGAEEDLVALSDAEDSSVLPALPRAGGLPPRWELLVSLRPDLVLADSAHERFRDDFARFHIPVRFYPATHAKSLEDVLDLIGVVGQDIGRTAAAGDVVKNLKKRLEEIDRRRPSGESPRAYFEIWPRPLQAVGTVSLQGHLLKRAGFATVAPDGTNEMPLVSAEWVVAQNPEWIFYTAATPRSDLLGRPGWERLAAVQQKRVIEVDSDLFSRAGPRAVDALDILLNLRAEARP